MPKKSKKIKKPASRKAKKVKLRPKMEKVSKKHVKSVKRQKKKPLALKARKNKEYKMVKPMPSSAGKLLKQEPVKVESPLIHLPSSFTIKVENVVAFATLGVDISLQKLVKEVENTEYEPEQFPGLVYRPTNPRAAALIFSSGKIVCTGAKSIENAKLAMQKVADTIRGVGIPVPKKFPI